jgi:thymidylate synthase
MKYFSIIFAADPRNGGFGYKNSLPWESKTNLKLFHEITTKKYSEKQNTLIMGRKTYESIGIALPNRLNIIISSTLRQEDFKDDIIIVNSLNDALDKSTGYPFLIGGVKLIEIAFENPFLEQIYQTHIYGKGDIKFDTFINLHKINQEIFHLETNKFIEENDKERINLLIMQKIIKTDENQYIKLLQTLLEKETLRANRTEVKTISVFGNKMEFDLDTFPLLTTKRVSFHNIFGELMWFLRGQTDVRILQKDNIHIWDDNVKAKHFGDKEYDAGPTYGFLFRHFGAKYVGCEADYTGQGFNQIKYVDDLLANDRNSRRILISLWNPCDIDKMSLPPCHDYCQFYVEGDNLECMMVQRSADTFLGTPYNIASYALLTYMFANKHNLKPRKLIYITGDTHLYSSHIDGAKEQINRLLRPFPVLEINKKVENIWDHEEEDFELISYHPHSIIKEKMVV